MKDVEPSPTRSPQAKCPPHPLGELLVRQQDAYGPVSIYAKGPLRYLSFGNSVEQSCIDLHAPHRPVHVYTQAMLIGLVLQPAAAHSLLLGLGGGSLLQALHYLRPRMRIEAVELRQRVIDLAQQYLALPYSPKAQLHCTDASNFVRDETRHYDLIMLDLYLAEGAHPAQTQLNFLRNCHARLSDSGILIANHWCSEFRDNQKADAALREVFGEQLLYLQVQGGNTLAFGFRDALPQLRRDELLARAQALGETLDIPLFKLTRNFWRQNAEPLQAGRFARV